MAGLPDPLLWPQRKGWQHAEKSIFVPAEELQGGDVEYVTWAGEAKLLAGLQTELAELEHAHIGW